MLTGSVCCTLLPGDTAQRDPILTLPMTHRRRGSPPLRDSATVTHPCVTGLSSSQLYLETMTPHLFIAMSRLCTATEKMAFCVITRWHCLPGNSHVSLHSHLPCSSPLHSYINGFYWSSNWTFSQVLCTYLIVGHGKQIKSQFAYN